jgi:hypothetical protein
MKVMPEGDVSEELRRVRANDVSLVELAHMARTGNRGLKGASLMRLVELYGQDPATVQLLEELATSSSKNEILMGTATVGHLCLLLLQKVDKDVFARLCKSWDPADVERMTETLRAGL